MSRGLVVSDRYRWAVVGMLWLVCFFNYADRQAIFSVFPLLREEMGLNNVQLGIVAGAFMWVYAAFGPIAGLIGDRLKVRISAAAEAGKANKSICTLLARSLGVKSRQVVIDSGQTNPEKIARIQDITVEDARARLRGSAGRR